MITRRILVTKLQDANGGTRFIYGRFDAVAIASKGEKILTSEFKNYRMTESEFVKHGKEIKNEYCIKV